MSRRTMLTQKILEQQKAQAKTGLATWDEVPYWAAPDEITGGINGFFLLDPRPLDQPDISLAQYAAEMDRRRLQEEDPHPEWAAADVPIQAVHVGWKDPYRVSCAMRRYVYPPSKPKPKKVEPVDAPEQVALDDENGF
jgi:hypothetical protein